MDLNEALSRLVEDELPEAEADALRRRIAVEPEVARAWARMQRLSERLDAMPVVPGAPRVSAGAVTGAAGGGSGAGSIRRRRGIAVAFGSGLAFAAGVALALRSPPTTVGVGLGESSFDGKVTVVAGNATIDVDGKVRVDVEPDAGAVRESSPENPAMDRTHALAALAGIAITVTVDAGRAVLHAPDGTDRTVGEHERSTISAAAAPSAIDAPSMDRPGPGGAAPTGETRIAALEKELSRLKLEQAITRGQLEQATGVAHPFPTDLPDAYQPGGFARRVEETIAATPEVSLVETDCNEYPCLAVVRTSHPGEGWQDALEAVVKGVKAGLPGGEDSNASEWISDANTPNGEVRLLVFALWPEGNAGVDVQSRTKFRADDLMQSTMEDAGVSVP